MRVCVVGAGAIGGFMASGLAAAGRQISVLARGATLAALRAHGLRVESADGTVTARVRASDDAAELGPHDVIVLAVKAQSAPAAAAGIGPLLGLDTIVLPTMNGVPWWFFLGDQAGGPCAGRHLDSVDPGGRIAAAISFSRVIGAVVHMSASSPEHGVVRHHSGNGLIIGEPSGADTPRLRDLAAMLGSAGLAVTVSQRIREDIWYKLWGNLTVNPVSALTGATADQILDDELVRVFCESSMLEAREIGARIGCPIGQTPADRNVITRKLGAFRTSMLQDAEAGRELELDALAGAVREIGTLAGVATPSVDVLYGLTRLSTRVRAQRRLSIRCCSRTARPASGHGTRPLPGPPRAAPDGRESSLPSRSAVRRMSPDAVPSQSVIRTGTSKRGRSTIAVVFFRGPQERRGVGPVRIG